MNRPHPYFVAALLISGISLFAACQTNAVFGQQYDGAVRTRATAFRQTAIPKARVQRSTFDFGTMESYERREHTFVVKNAGNANLTLKPGPTSCKCTVGHIADADVPPGEQTTVTIGWTSVDKQNGSFDQQAEVITNDPQQPVLVFRIRGKVRKELIANPKDFSIPRLLPGNPLTASLVVSSQVWQQFTISDVTSSLEGLTWEIKRTSQPAAGKLNAKGPAYRLTIQGPSELPKGYHAHWLRMRIQPAGKEHRWFEIPIQINVMPRVAIYGKGMDSRGTIRLGDIAAGKGLSRSFFVRVQDQQPELEVKTLLINPKFLSVNFLPDERIKKPGVYRMQLQIPKDAPVADFRDSPGTIHVEFKNPRLEHLDLRVQFAITDK